MHQKYCCTDCLRCQTSDRECRQCGGFEFVDLSAQEQQGEFFKEVRTRARSRRRKFVLVMEALAIILCAGFLFVGLTVASGLGGGAISWAVKLVVLGLFAGLWWAIPRIYAHYFRGPASRLLLEWSSRA